MSCYFPVGLQGKKPLLLESVLTRNAKILPAFILVVAQMCDLQLSTLCEKLVVRIGMEIQSISVFHVTLYTF